MELGILGYLAIALFAALLGGKIVKVLHLPNVTGYLVIGLIIGPYCLKIMPADIIDKLQIMSDVALSFIAFSIGAEFQLKYLKRIGKAPAVIGILEGVVATILVDFILIITGHDVTFSLCVGAIASATAAASTLMVVKQYKADGPVTRTLLPVVAIDDAVALMAFGISVAVAKAISNQGGGSMVETILDPVIEIGGGLLFGAVMGVLLAFLVKWFTGRGNRLAATIAMLFLCVGICNMYGLSNLLACMMMSAIFANTSKNADKIFEPIDRITPPIYMIFFIISGAALNIGIIPKVGLVGIIYIVFRVVGKFLGSYIGAVICKCDPKVKKWLGLTLVPQEGVAIGLATIAMGVVPEYGETIRTVVLCGIIVYELLGPMITKFALKAAGEIPKQEKGKV